MKQYKHILMILLIALVATIFLTACRGDDPTTETEAPTVTDTPTEQPTEAPTEAETPEPETYYFVDNVAPETESQAPETKPDEHYEYIQDFSEPISANDPDWTINEVADTSKGYLTATVRRANRRMNNFV